MAAPWPVLVFTLVRGPLGVIIVLALDSFQTPFEAPVRAPEERLGQYVLLRKLPAGLRAEVWLGLPPGAASLAQLVAVKAFFPHVSGAARAALSAELALASRLTHANILQTLHVGNDGGRPFIASEYLEGTTLHALLRRVGVARARIVPSALARLLLGIVRAVSHAERRVASPATKSLVRQAIGADDVFVTFDGGVKLLGFKGRGSSAERCAGEGQAAQGSNAPAAIDVLLSQHLTPALSDVLAAGCRPRAAALQGLRSVEQALDRWQSDVLGSDGRAELASLMAAMFPTARLEQRAWLEARLEERSRARSAGMPFLADADESAPPASGFRTVRA